ncbi:MAG: hypothetical protein LBC18_03260 [Opitutaceae bacterium]|jgi:hypothetical protein|nr:hypothetical protein [Opitutaceae bacterium]
MTPEIREQFRQEIIAILAVAGAVGMKRAALKMQLGIAGFEAIRDADLDNELDYLAGKGLAGRMGKLISPEVARWKLTAEGRDYAAGEGLA